MKYGGALLVISVAALVLASGCVSHTAPVDVENKTVKQLAIDNCIMLCQNLIESGADLTNGPCLSDNYAWNVSDWVCDIAHNPRMPIDNDPSNQCKAYISGKDHHFVELTPNCEFIRAR